MRLQILLAALLSFLSATTAHAALVNFSYSQSDAVTGSGTVAPFSVDDGGGPINFTATPMPSATVVNPNPGMTPAGFIGAQTVASGNGNENNSSTGIEFSGFITATGTRGTDVFTIQILLRFLPKQTQTPDINDYTWNVTFGDSALQDATSTSMRFAMYYARDDVVDAADTIVYQRYTQQNHTFAASAVDSFTNTDTTTTAIKDAVDGPGPDAENQDLAFYFGWRDQGALNSGAILVDNLTVGGLLNADESTLTLVPEPSATALAVAFVAGVAMRRRRLGRS